MPILLDTCIWLWLCSEPKKLSSAASEAIERERKRAGVIISAISCWEIAKLVQKGRLKFSITCRQWIDQAIRVEGLTLYPLTPEVCVESAELPGDFHGDPADQLIVSTARVLSVPVVTSDRKIRGYPHVPTLW